MTLTIASIGDDVRFDKDRLAVAAGSRVTAAFKNNGSSRFLQHTWVLVRQGTEDSVAAGGLAATSRNDWIPKTDPNVLAFTRLLDGGASGQVTFDAPPAGTYSFICTYPGHTPTMRGVFEVR